MIHNWVSSNPFYNLNSSGKIFRKFETYFMFSPNYDIILHVKDALCDAELLSGEYEQTQNLFSTFYFIID